MPTVISGILKDPIGKPIPNCTIELRALRTSTTVITKTIASQKFESNGSYSMNVESGRYGVTLSVEGYPPNYVGDITIDDKSEPGTLNDFLGALTDADLRPEAVKRFEAMAQRVAEQAAQVERDKEAANDSAAQASQSQLAAASSATDAAAQAEAADGSAKRTAQSAQAAKASEDNAGKSQTTAQLSAEQAVISASDASQSASEAAKLAAFISEHESTTAEDAKAAAQSRDAAEHSAQEAAKVLEDALKKENNLSEIAAAGDEALATARKNLGLGAAAVLDVQADIYDRREGRLALPGAFGYGAPFPSTKYFSAATGPEEFLAWVKEMPPGRYHVSQSGGNNYKQIIEGVVFAGIVEIMLPGPSASMKLIEFRGAGGNIYFNRLNSDYFVGWENLKPMKVRPLGGVGTFAMMSWRAGIVFPERGIPFATLVPASNLAWTNIVGVGETPTQTSGPLGTWQAHGVLGSVTQTALFYRVA